MTANPTGSGSDSGSAWAPGMEVSCLTRTMTAERMRWYADALETISHAGSPFVIAAPNIHTDDEIARANGLPSRVADGMVSTNWVASALVARFGDGLLRGGTLQTRYVRPIFVDDHIEVVARVVRVEDDVDPEGAAGGGGDGGRDGMGVVRLSLDVSCVKSSGEVATAGAATLLVPRR